MRFLIDTSALIDVFVNRKGAQQIRDFVRGKEFFISTITVYEPNKAKKLDQRIIYFLKNCNMFDLDMAAAEIASIVFKKLQEGGKAINEMDVLIVGIAIHNDLLLITKDKNFENVPEILHDFKVKIFS